jgi:hypothetical protein
VNKLKLQKVAEDIMWNCVHDAAVAFEESAIGTRSCLSRPGGILIERLHPERTLELLKGQYIRCGRGIRPRRRMKAAAGFDPGMPGADESG